MNLKTKLFFLTLTCFAILVLGFAFVVANRATRIANSSVETTLRRSQKVLASSLETRFNDLKRTAYSISVDPEIRPLVYTHSIINFPDFKNTIPRNEYIVGPKAQQNNNIYCFPRISKIGKFKVEAVYSRSSAVLQARLSDLYLAYKFDLLMFTDEKGVLIARSDKQSLIGKSIIGSSLIRSALTGQTAKGYMKRGKELLQITSVPIYDNVAHDLVRGSLSIAYAISSEIAQDIHQLTGSQIAFLTWSENTDELELYTKNEKSDGDALLASLGSDKHLLSLLAKEHAATWKGLSTIASESYLLSLTPLLAHDGRSTGVVASYTSKSEVEKPFREIIKSSFAIGLFTVLLGSLLAYLLARHISSPLVKLVGVADQIRDGAFPNYAPENRRDEIGVLSKAVYDMGESLKRKLELEEYLSAFSEEISLPADLGDEDEDTTVEHQNHEESEGTSSNFSRGAIVDARYEIPKPLGSGAMGLVYLAKDLALDELVALKTLSAQNVSLETLEAFKQEVRLARRIAHNNIVRTYEFSQGADKTYVVMEYVAGYSIQSFVKKKGPIQLDIGLLLAKQICAAMGAAHAQGVIHRDLKASNIVIDKRGVVKIMDFGIAMLLERRKFAANESSGAIHSQSSISLSSGTPLYMAPEQIRGEEQTETVDIYAMGVLLFFILTGKYPFDADNYFAIATKHIEEPPPAVSASNPELPKGLDAIIQKALAKTPNQRYESFNDLRLALESIN